jgi:hypothetical protein
LTGFGETAGAALAAHPDVDKVAFAGSAEVGKLIVQAAAGNLKKVSLELGGKSPAIILPDADLDLAIAGAANAIFFNHGQCCCAGSRLYAHKSVYDRVVAGVSEIAGKIKVGPGLDPATEMGPLVSDEQFSRVTGYIEAGRTEGAKIAVGGSRVGNLGYFVAPTVMENTTPYMKVIREEIFGPVVCATPFDDDDLDRIAKKANDTIYGLAASVWTRNGGTAHKLASRIRSGTVWINCHNVFDASLPFGGYKQSGWGREMGEEVLHNYTEIKTVTAALWASRAWSKSGRSVARRPPRLDVVPPSLPPSGDERQTIRIRAAPRRGDGRAASANRCRRVFHRHHPHAVAHARRMPQARQPGRADLFDRDRRTLARSAHRSGRSPPHPGALLDASRAPRSCAADANADRPDHRQLCVALAGAAEPDRLVDRRLGGDRGGDVAGAWSRLPGWHAADRSETGSRERIADTDSLRRAPGSCYSRMSICIRQLRSGGSDARNAANCSL